MTETEIEKVFDEATKNLYENWGEDGLRVIAICAQNRTESMSMNEFLNHCTCCGGNWGGMFLTGIKSLWPDVWEAIPDDMGVFAFSCICDVLMMCGVRTWEEK